MLLRKIQCTHHCCNCIICIRLLKKGEPTKIRTLFCLLGSLLFGVLVLDLAIN